VISSRILVTGASGFIGQHLCPFLVDKGRNVVACLRTESSLGTLVQRKESIEIIRTPRLQSARDIVNELRGVEVIIHLGGRAHVMREHSVDPLAEFRAANVETTRILAHAAIEAGVRRFVFVSSIKVNGESTDRSPFTADDTPRFCDSYGQSKFEAEECLRNSADGSAMEFVIVRPPLVYGPGVKGNFLSLLKSVHSGIPLPLGSLKNKRSLISIFNLVEFLNVVIDHDAAANNRFVVADQQDVSIPELIRSICILMRTSPQLLPCPVPVLRLLGLVSGKRRAVQRLCEPLIVDRSKVNELLGWHAPTTLEYGLERTVEWFIHKSLASAFN
jgi:nucleoside-diphosphate-sugar epimerase